MADDDDSNVPLSSIVKSRGKSVASLLLEIEEYPKPHLKRLSFIRNLECLVSDESSSEGPRLERRKVNAFKERNYVALSYTWDTSDQEDPRKGKYEVQTRDKARFWPSPVRDCVLDRVLSFMRSKGLGLLWIDRHCVKQNTCRGMCHHKRCNEKRSAIEAMDLVYRLSEHPVALLGRPIEWEEEMDLLFKLLKGRFDKGFDRTSHEEILRVLRLLSRITKDRWWTRAWTFQERYRAREKMILLIRHPDFLEGKKQAHGIFSNVRNELCIKSVDFCEFSTKLCLTVQAQTPQRDDVSHHTKSILHALGKYTVLLDKSMSMTPRIVADIQTRSLTDAWDKLAIIANCCQYTVRMDPKEMQTQKSLSIAILAMCLLNGEVLQNGSQDSPFSVSEKTISQYLEDQAFKRFCAPQSQQNLAFNKRCRFVDVKFRPAGIETKGHLWSLGRMIDTSKFRLPLPEAKRKSSSLSQNDERCLTQLAAELRHLGETSLAAQIARFLSHDPDRQREPFPMDYMCLMAHKLATAIVEGKMLRLGRIWNTRGEEVPSSAIFVWDLDDTEDVNRKGKSQSFNRNIRRSRKPKNAYAFTASKRLERGSQERGTNDLNRHLSLEVDYITSRENAGCPIPRLYIKRWAVGICFFYGSARSTVIFPWPSTFLETPSQ
ncbi:hypothetical protein FSPOR_8755 [Fusarium sporotrichioides]|uniref:Heterokaryon incompatibility domain-containing protein n=1 Tax=Fusarium sporotrichioides TaxID=5514 RepID=A0A395RSY1_FUSSP|nr:hypothetical protein FSPOR_8755 [Fusarium sporotrichioides]